VGAAQVLREAEEYPSIAAAVADCSLVVGTGTVSRRKPVLPVWSLPQAVPLLHQHVQGEGQRVALLFGSEKRGLANEDLSHCDWLLNIPTGEAGDGNDSMNLGQAVAVCLYAITCGGSGEGAAPDVPMVGDRPRASAGETERLLELLHECLMTSGYLSAEQRQSAEQTHRRLLQEAGLSSKQIELAMGMLRSMLRTMRLR
jgi:tRNA/rRNA methyltransferase